MEAVGRLEHRTDSKPSIGWPGWVSVLINTTPDIRSCRGVETAGAAATSLSLNPGDLHGSLWVGPLKANDDGPMPVEKSDYPIRAMTPGNAGRAKGITGCKESDIDNWNSCSQLIRQLAGVDMQGPRAYPRQRHGYGI